MRPLPAVLLLIYRRPELTARVLEVLREVRPPILLVAADGAAGEEDQALCARTRELVEKGVDWPCQVRTRFSTEHLGCKRAVSGALNWAFAEHERVIVLEDDTVPEPSFFSFCAEMLERYAGDERVMQVCGSNLTGWRGAGASYHFSRFGPIWGWASWRRAWRHCDADMSSWPEQRHSLARHCPEPFEAAWRREVFDDVYQGRIDTWDYQWAYAKAVAGGLNIVPSEHLVANVGFGAGATHTLNAEDPRGRLATAPLPFPLRHPGEVAADVGADQAYLRQVVGLPGRAWSRDGVRWLLKRAIRGISSRRN